jgi:flagellar biosynthetic protein FlhB
MAEETTSDEKTESATPKRLLEARERGQVPRSTELSAAAVVLAGAAALHFLGAHAGAALESVMRAGLEIRGAAAVDGGRLVPALGGAALATAIGVLPLLGATFVAALVAPLALSGWNFSTEALVPDFGRLNPLTGVGRLFSLHGAVELGKSLAKFAVIATIAVWVLRHDTDALLALGAEPTMQGIGHAMDLAAGALLRLASGLLIIAAVDVPFQLWENAEKLKMSREEIKQEFKETEGSQEVKGKIRMMQRAIAKRRMMLAVPKADVVVVNPTHYAVALQYDERRMRAPHVVAKGADLIATRIREIATEHGVAIVEAPPLARALHRYVEIDAEVPAVLYVAVAQVLSYVFQLRAATKGGLAPPVVPVIDPASIPPELAAGEPEPEA